MYDALAALSAPPNLIAWASAEEREHRGASELLSLNQDPSWAIWMYAAAGLPLRALLDVALLEADEAVQRLSEAQAPLMEALRLARELRVGRGDTAAVLAAAERADVVAECPIGSYRALSTQPVVTPTAIACSYVARASEALCCAELSLATQRMVSAQGSAAMLGMGASALMNGRAPALCLNPATVARDPVQRVALFVPAAVAEAVAQLLLAEERREHGPPAHAPATAMNARFSALLTPFLRG